MANTSIPQLCFTVTVCTDGSFMAVAARTAANGITTQQSECGETKQELFEWLDRQVEQPTMQ